MQSGTSLSKSECGKTFSIVEHAQAEQIELDLERIGPLLFKLSDVCGEESRSTALLFSILDAARIQMSPEECPLLPFLSGMGVKTEWWKPGLGTK